MSDKENLKIKTEKYKSMLYSALNDVNICIHEDTYLFKLIFEFKTMAESYYNDGVYFINKNDYVNALACFSYGYGWLDAGIRLGGFEFSIDNNKLFSF